MKKIGILLTTVIMMMLFAVSVSAKEIAPTGKCGDNVYWSYNSSTGELVISGEGAMMDYSGSNSPFYDSNIKSVVIESGVTTIGEWAFYYCYIFTNVAIPDSVTTIGSYAFRCCSSLTSIIIPDSITTIAHSAFADTGYYNNSSNWENSVLYIGKYLIKAESSFSGSYTIKEGTKLIANSAFGNCASLTGVTIPDSVTNIGEQAFHSCTILTSVTIPDSVTTIDLAAFHSCTSLTSVRIPESVRTIGNYAFYYCIHLTDVYYVGTEEQWNDVEIGFRNDNLLNADINYHYGKHSYNAVVTDPTCTTKGYTTYTCECGDTYTSDYVKENGHSHTSEITTPATHTKDGVETFTCHCGDTYTQSIPKLTEHTYTSSVTTEPTHLKEGVRTYTCECTHSYTESISKLTEHTYIPTVTPPTCTTPGYTTYTCECGDKYFDNFVDERHTFSNKWTIDEEPTCKYEGIKSRHCEFCPARTDITTIGKLAHNFVSVRIEPSCLDDGRIITACKCGEEIIENIPATGHNIVGSACTECDYDKSFDCSCNCHKSGIPHLIFKILNFFQKLFGKNKICACGVEH